MDETDIAPVLDKARGGDTASLATICARFYPKVLKYMRYRVGSQAAEDLTGDVFLRMLRHIARQHGSFTAWLYRIAANVVNDHIRERMTRPEVATERLETLPAPAVGNGDNPARVVSRKLDLETALARLTDDQRQLVTLKFIQGLSTEEVAEVMERTPGAIRVLQFRALAALRELLPQYEVNHE